MGRRLGYLQGLFNDLTSRIAANTSTRNTSRGSHTLLSRLDATCAALMGDASESEQLRLAAEVFDLYWRLEPADKAVFFQGLIDNFSAAPQAIHEAYARYRASEDNGALQDLLSACEPKRQELLRRLNRCEGATFDLIKMRAELLLQLEDRPALQVLDHDFSHLLKSWFNLGFLTVERIDWSSAARVLEKIIQYEAVHAISSWDELRKRMNPDDRRCYAFFHSAVDAEPLIFVEVALSKGIPGNIQEILDGSLTATPDRVDTAVFYSISNCQPGLKGIALGNSLIKQVAQRLKQEMPAIRQFVTLSPVPGLRDWIAERAATELPDYTPPPNVHGLINEDDNEAAKNLATELRQLAAYYLCYAKAPDRRPYDAVARFHLGNGAVLHRINWQGDVSEKGQQQSLGIMANYLYDIEKLEQNYRDYTKKQKVTCSAEIAKQADIIKQKYQTSNIHAASSA